MCDRELGRKLGTGNLGQGTGDRELRQGTSNSVVSWIMMVRHFAKSPPPHQQAKAQPHCCLLCLDCIPRTCILLQASSHQLSRLVEGLATYDGNRQDFFQPCFSRSRGFTHELSSPLMYVWTHVPSALSEDWLLAT